MDSESSDDIDSASEESDADEVTEVGEAEEPEVEESPVSPASGVTPQDWNNISKENAEELEESGKQEAVATAFSGPIPPPGILRAYDDVVQDGAERIISMAEDEQDHRHEIERGYLDLAKWGQRFGFIIGFGALVCGTLLIALGHSVSGLIALLAVAGGVVGSLVLDLGVASEEEQESESESDQETDVS